MSTDGSTAVEELRKSSEAAHIIVKPPQTNSNGVVVANGTSARVVVSSTVKAASPLGVEHDPADSPKFEHRSPPSVSQSENDLNMNSPVVTTRCKSATGVNTRLKKDGLTSDWQPGVSSTEAELVPMGHLSAPGGNSRHVLGHMGQPLLDPLHQDSPRRSQPA